jgi:hypothetical protein
VGVVFDPAILKTQRGVTKISGAVFWSLAVTSLAVGNRWSFGHANRLITCKG